MHVLHDQYILTFPGRKYTCRWGVSIYHFRMSKSPATPQKPGLLLHTQKAFPGKYKYRFLKRLYLKYLIYSTMNRFERLQIQKINL